MFNNSTILIVGGTSYFSYNFVKMTLEKYNPKKIIIFSRNEQRQLDFANSINDKRLRCFIGDIRDKDRLYRALDHVDYVINNAVLKNINVTEYNPFECVKTNLLGAMNLIDACIDKGVKKVITISSDKATKPVNLYGATKLCADKLFISGNSYSGSSGTRFSVVRYGNVIGEPNSVIETFKAQIAQDKVITTTDNRMTRFMITPQKCVELVWQAFDSMEGGEIFVSKTPSMKLIDIARAVSEKVDIIEKGVRKGEKLHEQMINNEEAPYTYEYPQYYKIFPAKYDWCTDFKTKQNGVLVTEDFEYTSDNNNSWLTIKELKDYIDNIIF